MPIKDITNQKFYRLTALYPTSKRDSDRSVIWHCRCDCGNEVDVSGKRLRQGNTKSCGCLNTETRAALGRSHKKDLVGMVFGRLTVLEDSGERYDNNILWRCQCECGNQPLVKGTSLLHGTKSCGCLLSKGEARIAEILTSADIKFETQKTFKNCRFEDSNRPAFFDFYLPDYNLLIEYDGEQHFYYKGDGWNTKENFEKTKARDAYKDKWCQKNSIRLKRVPYTQFCGLTLNDLIGECAETRSADR